MTDPEKSPGERGLAENESFTPAEDGYSVSTTVFDAVVSAHNGPEGEQYTVTVTVPTIDSATNDQVGPTVQQDWFETFERRLRDAPKATRKSVEIDELQVSEEGDSITVIYRFNWENPTTAAEIAKTFVEYVEGTYVEGIIPGYEYTSPVADLISDATQGGDGGTPL